ncbi:importin beta SAD2-like protein [Trifolium repens]|nr:importin beta SAD2-like protein [Trifolium repens]
MASLTKVAIPSTIERSGTGGAGGGGTSFTRKFFNLYERSKFTISLITSKIDKSSDSSHACQSAIISAQTESSSVTLNS